MLRIVFKVGRNPSYSHAKVQPYLKTGHGEGKAAWEGGTFILLVIFAYAAAKKQASLEPVR